MSNIRYKVELTTHSSTWYGIILVYAQILLLENILEMFGSILLFPILSDNAKNGSDPITDPITGSALIEIEICTLHEFLYNIFVYNLMMLLHFQDCYAPKYFKSYVN